MNRIIKIILIIVFIIAFILIIRSLTSSILKQYKKNCGDGYMMGKNNLCRQICDTDKDPNCQGNCSHPEPGGTGCVKCTHGKVWTGDQCIENCNDHGSYDRKSDKCNCHGSQSKFAPPKDPINDKSSGSGWDGGNCQKSRNMCTSTGNRGGTEGAPENLLGWPKFTPTGVNTAQPLQTCSGHGFLRNDNKYTKCMCDCDAGWGGKNCDTLSSDPKGKGSCQINCKTQIVPIPGTGKTGLNCTAP